MVPFVVNNTELNEELLYNYYTEASHYYDYGDDFNLCVT